ncbi:hypothetical protein H0E87_031275, partial [Populus deltoides]
MAGNSTHIPVITSSCTRPNNVLVCRFRMLWLAGFDAESNGGLDKRAVWGWCASMDS